MPRFLGSLAILLSLSFSSARAAIVPGPDVAPVREVLAPTEFGQYFGRIAAGDDGYLAVWRETAALPPALLATRISADGIPTDAAAPLVVARTAGLDEPALVWDGRRYLVVWNDSTGALFGRFVERDGTMPEAFRIAGSARYPQVAFNGREFLVAWSEPAGFRAALLDADGRVTRLEDLGRSPAAFAIATVGGVFHIATVIILPGDAPIYEVGITPIRDDGTISRRVVVATMHPAHVGVPVRVQAASLGDEAVVAWSSEGKISTMRISGTEYGEAQSFDGTLEVMMADLLVYGDRDGYRWLRRVGSATASRLPMPPRPSLAISGANGLLLVSTVANDFDIDIQRLDDGSFTPLTVAPRHQVLPAIAGTAALRLAVWTEDDTLVAARIGPNGRSLDPDGINLGVLGTGAVVAMGDGEWLIAWSGQDRVLGMRVSFDGTLLDAAPITIAEEIHFPDRIAAAWDGTRFVVAFMDGVPTRFGGLFTVKAARIGEDGVVESPVLAVSDNSANRAPAIAAGPNNTSLIAWTHDAGSLHGALVSPGGAVTPIAFPAGANFRDREVSVAWNGTTWLVAAPEGQDRIRWFFVSAAGTVTPAPASAYLTYHSLFGLVADVEPLGDGFLLVYESDSVIYAATINRNGYIAHGPTTVATTTIASNELRVGASGSMIIYARPTDPLRNRLTRVFVKELTIVPNPPKRRAVRR